MTRIQLPRPKDPDVSVVVLGYRRADALARCLASLAAQETGVAYEVIVVLNGATPDVSRVALDDVDGAVVVRSPVNLGYAVGCNRGAAASSAPMLAFLNDDAVADPGWLEALVRAAARRPAAAAIGPLVLFEDGTVQETGGGRVLADGTFEALGEDAAPDDPAVSQPRPIDYATGAGSLVRREAWDEVHGMDETYFPAYFEDIDLGLRLARAGWELWYEPEAVVRHERGGSTAGAVRLLVQRSNRARFLARWGPGGDPDAVVEEPSHDPGERAADIDVDIEPLHAARAAAFEAAVLEVLTAEVDAARDAVAREKAAHDWLNGELERERAHARWLAEQLADERRRPAGGRVRRGVARVLAAGRQAPGADTAEDRPPTTPVHTDAVADGNPGGSP